MKRIIFAVSMLVYTSVAFAQQFAINSKTTNVFNFDNAIFGWAETAFDFGKIKINIPVTHEFTFINKGSAPLLISSVQASCGCTVTEYSKEAIAPGQQGYVKATYNAAKVGVFAKTVTVMANTNDTTIQLAIKGEVVGN